MKVRDVFHLRPYLTEKTKCFIPLCKAHCCADVPLPEHWVNNNGRFELRAREVYSAVNVGKNEAKDNYNSIIFNTRPIPLVIVGIETRINEVTKEMEYAGHRYYYDRRLAEALGGMSPQEATDKLLAMEAQKIYNYCPFLDEHGRCVCYPDRSRLCREFGNVFPGREINYCKDKCSRLDIIKFYLKELTLRKMFLFYKNLILNALRKPQPAC